MHRTENASLRPDRLWNPQFTLLIAINVITNIGFGMLLTSISLYVVNMGASLAIAGSMASVFSLVAMFMRPLGGRLFDCFNKRNSFILSTLAYGAISVLYSFTTNVPMLFLLRIVHGIAFSLSGVTNMALVSLFISKKRMNEGLGYYNAVMLIGQAVAPSIAQYLIGTVGFFWLYIIVGLFIMLPPLFCLTMKMPEAAAAAPSTAAAPSKRRFSIDNFVVRHLILYAIVGSVFSFYNGIANSFMLLLGEARHIENISLFFTVSSGVLLAVRIFGSSLTDRLNMNWLVNGALVTSIISLLLISKTHSLSLVLAAAALKALGQGVGQVVLQGEALKRADPGSLGIATGTMFMGNDLGNTLGPVIGGAITDSLGYWAMFYVGIAAFALAMAAFIIYQKRKQQTAA